LTPPRHPRVFEDAPTLLGHRGLGRGTVDGHDENTLGSFLAAAEAGVDWVEVDVRRTADDDLVVLHDPAWDDGTFVVDVTGAEALSRGALRVAELLDALPVSVGVDFDLKSSLEDATCSAGRTTAALLAPVARRAAQERPAAVTSFDPGALGIVRALAPELPLGLLTWLRFPVGHAVSAAAHLDVDFLAVHVGSIVPNPIEPAPQQRPLDYVFAVAHRAGRQVLAWCPEVALLDELVAAGVDAACVNDVPDTLAHLRG
jgi:glycerophosphoryl diester phosphodiesterase